MVPPPETLSHGDAEVTVTVYGICWETLVDFTAKVWGAGSVVAPVATVKDMLPVLSSKSVVLARIFKANPPVPVVAGVAESLMPIRIAKSPATVGVPEMIPPASVRPAGRFPWLMANVYGGVPPLAERACEGYSLPTTPEGSGDLVVNCRAAGRTFKVAWAETVAPTLSLTWTVKVDEPTAVGIPLMIPVAVSDIPLGKAPPESCHWYGGVPPVAVKLWV